MNSNLLRPGIGCVLACLLAIQVAHGQTSSSPPANAPKSDAPKSDAPKSDAQKSDAQKSDAPKPAPVAGRAVLGVTVAETQMVAPGYRATRLLNKEVLNEKGDKIGKIDDLVIAPDGTLSIAVVNVGGFVGIAGHRVAIPVRQFERIAPKPILPGATKESLKALPDFRYA
jgi:sporulation protein YlmC with PRC-barrel domain